MDLLCTEYHMVIDGVSVAAASGERFCRISPAHDVVVGTYDAAGPTDVDRAVAAARHAFDEGPWPRLTGAQRARALRAVAESIERDVDRLAFVEVVESGKPITQARAEMQGVCELWWFAATLAQHAHGDAHNALGESLLAMTLREPTGVVGMITPWNFPLLIVSQKLPYALAVGCTAVVKPSELTPGTTIMLAELIREAGIPDGVVNVVTGDGAAGARLAAHPAVDMVSFTGSTGVGRAVMAAGTPTLKRVSLELGGKNPLVVMPDADLDAAADAAVFGAMFNQGECCNSASRLLIDESIADEFEAMVLELLRGIVVDDPLDPATLVGAIISDDHLAKIEALVAAGRSAGAHLALGGGRADTPVGRFFDPTMFTGVDRDMAIASTEIFGPVLSVLRFAGLDDAVALTNATDYGLSAGIWTSDLGAATAFARRSKAGTVWVNCWMDGFPELCFGGVKQSGLGRELGRHAIEEFTEMKSLVIRTGARTMWTTTGNGA
jgi:betaine-aldehyde dehydrogenase